MTDQHRFDALGCVNSRVLTPNLDKLAASGIRYTQAVCNIPMCVPSRYSMMLGLYGSQSGSRHNTQIVPEDSMLPLPVIPQRLRDMGYQTVGIGKTHWYEDQAGCDFTPSTRGFEIRAIARGRADSDFEEGAVMWGDEFPVEMEAFDRETAHLGRGHGGIEGFKGRTSAIDGHCLREGWLTRKAVEFLDSGRDPERPWFLYLSFDYPHCALHVPPGFEELYNIDDIPDPTLAHDWENILSHSPNRDWELEWARLPAPQRKLTVLRYWALCTYVDSLFGRVFEKIRETGELDNTFIIFCSDHGDMLADRYNRFDKFCLYEGSIRVPLLISGTGVPDLLRGSTDDRPAELVDVLPTLIAIAGGQAEPELPGRSLLSTQCRIATFTEMHGKGYENLQAAPAYCWRKKDWKLILWLTGNLSDAMLRLDDTKGELYNLEKDPVETNNLYHNPDLMGLRDQMTRELLMHLACNFAKYPPLPGKPKIIG